MKKIIFSLLIIISLLSLFRINLHAESEKFFTISANPAENSNNSMNIVWHTEKDVTGTSVIYTKKSDINWENAVTINGKASLNKAFAGLNAKYGTTSNELNHPYEFMKNEATLTDLDEGTQYMYKITDGTISSDVRYFKTGKDEFNFVWTSDFHAYYADGRRLAKATQAINECINLEHNNIDFILSTGDIVAHGGTYQWWKQVSEASWIKNYMFSTTLGNHDWMTSNGTNYSDGSSFSFMDACYNNPRNGFSGQENICYFFYYGDALFISVNTETESSKYLGMTSSEFIEAQQNWVEEVLQNNSAQYIFLFQHYQAFNTTGAYNSAGYNRWHDICDRYGVDIFFSGNSHVYMRSLPIYDGEIINDNTKGTVYMVAPSSDGERGVEYKAITSNTDKIVKSWSETTAKAASVLEVTKTGINFKLVNYDGTILDSATILPKRAPSGTIDTNLTDFDKEAFESSFTFSSNPDDIATPFVNFSSDAHKVLKSLKIYNKDNLHIYYNGLVFKNTTSLTLNNVDKGLNTFIIELRYIDSSTKILEIEFDNKVIWGSINNIKINKINEDYYLEWEEDLNYNVVSSKNVYIDGKRYKRVDDAATSFKLPNNNGNHEVELIIRDYDGEIVYQSDKLTYQIIKKYIVTFVDSDGNELKKEEVIESSNATPPDYVAPSGYKFIGWDQDFNNIKSDLIVKVTIEKIEEIVIEPNPIEPASNNKKSCKKKSIMDLIAIMFIISFVGYLYKKKH